MGGYSGATMVTEPVYQGPLIVGNNFVNTAPPTSGVAIDNVAFWVGTELTPQQVLEHYQGRNL
jgi:hypothetical protein